MKNRNSIFTLFTFELCEFEINRWIRFDTIFSMLNGTSKDKKQRKHKILIDKLVCYYVLFSHTDNPTLSKISNDVMSNVCESEFAIKTLPKTA